MLKKITLVQTPTRSTESPHTTITRSPVSVLSHLRIYPSFVLRFPDAPSFPHSSSILTMVFLLQVYKDVCLTTPGTCFSGPTGTDKISYTLGCCNGCGPGGSCDLNGPPAGPMTYQCNCGEVMRRQAFNGLIGNTTWTA